jgi:hypothetical protein
MKDKAKNQSDYFHNQNHTYSRDETFYEPLKDVESMHDLYLLFEKMKSEFNKELQDALKNADHWCNATPTPEKPTWITTIDVIKNYPISRRTLQKLRNNKRIPFSRIGRKCIYKPEDIEEFMKINYTKKNKKRNKIEQ